ncbi:MAG: hypothetical protein WKG07_03740 [Hymenobacter sp.]
MPEARDLTKHYGDFTALHPLNLHGAARRHLLPARGQRSRQVHDRSTCFWTSSSPAAARPSSTACP